MLIYTNTRRVWRVHSRGDYWVLDRASGKLHQLGGKEAPEATLMFAKFSPADSNRMAYVRDKNVYVEDLATGRIEVLTKRSRDTVINGTFDWVYEEELGLRDGFRWSPDGKRIAYWQMDEEGVKEMHMINNVPGNYPQVVTFRYPKVGETNAARGWAWCLRTAARRPGCGWREIRAIITSLAWIGRITQRSCCCNG